MQKFITFVIIVAICLLPAVAYGQEGSTIIGKVTDQEGNVLPGANVYLEGTTYGAATNAKGEFRIPVPAEFVTGQEINLIARFIGYKSTVLPITLTPGTINQNFDLAIDILQLETVVVTGMGVGIEKEKLGVTISRVEPEEIVNSDESSIVAALHGKAANVEITSNSGDPGAATYIRIRGANTVTGGTQPLFVVDGSPVDNSSILGGDDAGHAGVMEQNRAADINPEDVESIEILKGAAASAIYGSRAANGVVLVTTKSGRPGRPRLSYKMSYTFDEVNKYPDLQTTYGQTPGYYTSYGPKLSGQQVFNHANEMFETGHTFENNLTLSGGNEWTTYYLSLGQTNMDGAIKGNSDYKRNNVRIKASQRINNKFNLIGGVTISRSNSNRIQKGSNISGLLLGAWRTPPDFNNQPYLDPVTGYHRSYRYPSALSPTASRGYDNPFFVVNEGVNESDVARGFGNLKLEYDPFHWLNMSYTLGHDFWSDERRTVLPQSSSEAPGGKVVRDKFNNSETDGLLTVSASRAIDFADMNVNVLAGHQWNVRNYNEFTTIGDEMGVYGFNQLDNTISYSPNEYEETIHDEAFFGQVMVDLYNQLYLSGALRNDGSSTFSQEEKRHWYPKVSGSWEFTKLSPFAGMGKWLNFGKLRAAWGVAGKQPNPYSMITGYASGAYTDGWTRDEGLKPSYLGYSGFWTSDTKGQDKIKPERTTEIELGAEFAFLSNRLGFNITYYNQKTEDAILSFPIPRSTGYYEQLRNAGKIDNWGWELDLNVQPISMKDFKWDMSFLYGRNDNEVDLAGAENLLLGGFFGGAAYAVDGEPLGVIMSDDFIRFGLGNTVVDADGNQIKIDDVYAGQWKPGELYINEDGFPEYDPQERVAGNPNPDWTGSFRTAFTLYNKLQISALIDIKQGGVVWNGTKGALYFFGTHADTDVEAEDADGVMRRGSWRTFEGVGPGAGTAVFLDEDNWYGFGLGNSFTGPARQFLEDGSYVKLREISIAYKFTHPNIRKWTGLSDIDVRLSGRNLHTWTDYTGIDPETNLAGNTNWRGLDYFNNPQTRSYVLTLRLNY